MIRREEINGVADSLKAPTSAVPDRSEIGPYLGSLRATFTVVTQGRTTALASTTNPTQNRFGLKWPGGRQLESDSSEPEGYGITMRETLRWIEVLALFLALFLSPRLQGDTPSSTTRLPELIQVLLRTP